MSEERVDFTIVLDGIGDPRLYEVVGERCALHTCHRLLRGAVVRVGNETYHRACAPRPEPKPERWRKPEGA